MSSDSVLNGLTSFDQIRGILTVSEADLPNEALSPYGLDDDLADNLEGWLPMWATYVDMDDNPQVSRALRLYAKYYCASLVAITAQAFMLKQYTDGENAGQRSDKDGFSSFAAALSDRAAGYRRRILALLEEDPDDTSYLDGLPSLITVSSPTRDVVKEGRS